MTDPYEDITVTNSITHRTPVEALDFDVVDAEPLPDVRELLRIERAQTVAVWTLLNELRLRDELPAWAKRSFPEAGSRIERCRQQAAERQVDNALVVLERQPRVPMLTRRVC